MDKDEKGDESQFKLRTRQLLAASCPLLATFTSGIVRGFNELLFSLTRSSNTEKVRSDFQISENALDDFWISHNNWMIFGSFLSGAVIEKLGRRRAMTFSFSVSFIGWLIISFATNLTWFKIGTSICSLSAGLLVPLAPIYIVEISDHVFRSLLLSVIDAAMFSGMLTMQILGLWLDLKRIIYIYTILALISSLITIATRESPIWLMNNGRTEEALARWVELRGSKSVDEYRALESVYRSRENEDRNSDRSKISSLIHTFLSRRFLWPLATACAIVFLYRFSGHDMLFYPTIIILKEIIKISQIELIYCLVTAIRCVITVLSCYLMFKFKRRTIAMFCGFSTVVGVFFFSMIFYLDLEHVTLEIVVAMLYVVLLMSGLSTLQWISGELFAGHLRSFGVSFVATISFGCITIDNFLWKVLLGSLHAYAICAVYGSLMLFAIGLLHWKQPETKDKTLLEIEEIYDKNSEELGAGSIEMMEREIET